MNLGSLPGSATLPPPLGPGDLIGIVAPARWLDAAALARGAAALAGDRYRLRIAPETALRDHQFAGDDAARAESIMAMVADPEVRAIVCAKGGYGSPRIVDRLDYAAIARHPKRFVGYSDVTALLLSVTRRAGLVTFHGPMLVDLAGPTLDQASRAHLQAMLADDAAAVAAAAESLLRPARVLRPGTAEGRLIGGNLSLLVGQIGTPSEPETDGAILFVEDVDEHLYHLDRMLLHLRRAGKLDRLAGLILGEMTDIKDNAVPFGADFEAIALAHLGDAAIPVVADFPCGHGARQMTLPVGARMRLAADARGVRLAAAATD